MPDTEPTSALFTSFQITNTTSSPTYPLSELPITLGAEQTFTATPTLDRYMLFYDDDSEDFSSVDVVDIIHDGERIPFYEGYCHKLADYDPHSVYIGRLAASGQLSSTDYVIFMVKEGVVANFTVIRNTTKRMAEVHAHEMLQANQSENLAATDSYQEGLARTELLAAIERAYELLGCDEGQLDDVYHEVYDQYREKQRRG